MSYNYTLKYKKFDELLSEIKIDFQNYDLEHMIEPAQLIKIAKRVNYDLGLRIAITKEAILEVEKGRVKLPDNFYVLNYALICDQFSETLYYPQGTNIQEIPATTPYQETPAVINTCVDGPVNCKACQQPVPCTCGCPTTIVPAACSASNYNPLIPFGDSCIKPRVFMNCKNDCYELVQIINPGQTYTYKVLLPIKILENPETIECECPNLYINSTNTAWIQNGFLFTNFKTAKVYINYQSMMEDDDGNLLVPDHDMLNEYYEYSLKERLLENLMMNDEPVGQKLQLVQQKLRMARNNALSIVNTPNFSEMKQVFHMNRRAQYARYYDMFKTYNGFTRPNVY